MFLDNQQGSYLLLMAIGPPIFLGDKMVQIAKENHDDRHQG